MEDFYTPEDMGATRVVAYFEIVAARLQESNTKYRQVGARLRAITH